MLVYGECECFVMQMFFYKEEFLLRKFRKKQYIYYMYIYNIVITVV